jgi:GT2 family glycosyltransferase
MERAEFHRIGGFDERYFLYFEDIDLCLRYRAHGGSITRDADFVVEHRRGGSQVGAWRCQKRCYYASQSLFFNRYGRRFDRLILGWLRNLFGA